MIALPDGRINRHNARQGMNRVSYQAKLQDPRWQKKRLVWLPGEKCKGKSASLSR
jgi:hypothetical protein